MTSRIPVMVGAITLSGCIFNPPEAGQGYSKDSGAEDIFRVVLDAGENIPIPDMDAGREDGSIDVGITTDGGVRDAEGPEDLGAPTRPEFPYAPSNFDPADPSLDLKEEIDISEACTFDTDALSFDGCTGPQAQVYLQSGAPEVALIASSGLILRAGAKLRVVGGRPLILAIYGKAAIEGQLDGSAVDGAHGPGGAGALCADSTGVEGNDFNNSGGGGGGFGSVGGGGGGTGGGAGGLQGGNPDLRPLRGGCPGGRGGNGTSAGGVGGGAGGAIQISVAGELKISGTVSVAGGGAGGGPEGNNAGGGGGSGGALLLEADSIYLDGAKLTANGGAGGSSGGAGIIGEAGEDGEDGHAEDERPARGGMNNARGGNGATMLEGAQAGDTIIANADGGGGGGVGRVKVQARLCTIGPLGALMSPLPVGCLE